MVLLVLSPAAGVATGTPDAVAVTARRQIAVLYNGPTAGRDEWYFTQLTNLSMHHYNPFVSPDGKRVGYHRCRCLGANAEEYIPVLEPHTSPVQGAGPRATVHDVLPASWR